MRNRDDSARMFGTGFGSGFGSGFSGFQRDDDSYIFNRQMRGDPQQHHQHYPQQQHYGSGYGSQYRDRDERHDQHWDLQRGDRSMMMTDEDEGSDYRRMENDRGADRRYMMDERDRDRLRDRDRDRDFDRDRNRRPWELDHQRDQRSWGTSWGRGQGQGQNLAYGYGGQQGYEQQQYERGPHYGRGPKGYKRSDERVREDVCEVMFRQGYIDASEVEVTVEGNVVILRGTVPQREAKRMLEQMIENVPGVEDVRNEIRVKRPEGSMREQRDYSPTQNQNVNQTTQSGGPRSRNAHS